MTVAQFKKVFVKFFDDFVNFYYFFVFKVISSFNIVFKFQPCFFLISHENIREPEVFLFSGGMKTKHSEEID